MAKQTRIGIYGGFTPTALDTSASDKMRALAGFAQTVGDTTVAIGKPIIEAKRAEEGAQAVAEGAGKIDPQTGEVLESPTINAAKWGSAQYASAANQALAQKGRNAASAYKATISKDSRETIANAAIQYKEDPVGFGKRMDSYRTGTLGAINDPALKAEVDNLISNRIFSNQIQLQDAFDVKELNSNIKTTSDESEAAFNNAEKFIVSGSIDQAKEELETAMKAALAVEKMNPDYDAEADIASMQRQFDSTIFKVAVSNVADTGDFAAANQMIIDETDKIPDNFSVGEWEAAISNARKALVQQKSIFDSAQQVNTQQDKNLFNDSLTIISTGGDLNQDNLEEINRIAGSNVEANKRLNIARQTGEVSQMSQNDRTNVLLTIDRNDPDSLDLLNSLAAADSNIRTSLRQDSWATASVQKMITKEEQTQLQEFNVAFLLNEDLNVEQQAVFQESFKQNEAIAERLTAHYGYQFSPLNKQQVSALSAAMDEMSPGQSVELVNSIGPTSQVWPKLYKGGSGLYALAATIKDPVVQRAIFAGNIKLQSGTMDTFKKEGDTMNATFTDYVGDSLEPDMQSLVYDAALAHYASNFTYKAYKYDSSDFENSIKAVSGGVTKIRDQSTILPSYESGNNDGTAKNLEGFFSDMTAEQLVSFGGVSEPYVRTKGLIEGIVAGDATTMQVESDWALEKLQNWRIKRVNGQNNYIVVEPVTGVVLTGADGNDVIFNVSAEKMNEYVSSSEDMERYRNFLRKDKFARDVMGLFEESGSPYFEATGAREYESGMAMFNTVMSLGLLDKDASGDYVKSLNKKPFEVTDEVMDVGDLIKDPSVGSNPTNANYDALKPNVEGDGLNITEMEVNSANEKVIESALQQKTNLAKEATNVTELPIEQKTNLYSAVEMVESGGDVNAVSSKGAIGPMQLMPETAKNPGYGITPVQNDSPAENRRVGREYLDAMLNKYKGNLDFALVAYNWGPSNTDKWIKGGGDKSKLPKETRDYLDKVNSIVPTLFIKTVNN